MTRAIDGAALNGLHVLVVEDVADIRDVFVLLLQAEGAQVFAAGNGRDGLDAAEAHDFDVVVSDLGLPDVPGELVIRELVSRARVRPRIVVVTGYGEPHISRALEAGADVVLTKPVPWPRLVEALRTPEPSTLAA